MLHKTSLVYCSLLWYHAMLNPYPHTQQPLRQFVHTYACSISILSIIYVWYVSFIEFMLMKFCLEHSPVICCFHIKISLEYKLTSQQRLNIHFRRVGALQNHLIFIQNGLTWWPNRCNFKINWPKKGVHDFVQLSWLPLGNQANTLSGIYFHLISDWFCVHFIYDWARYIALHSIYLIQALQFSFEK